jgi:hypothetical protein
MNINFVFKIAPSDKILHSLMRVELKRPKHVAVSAFFVKCTLYLENAL